MRKYRKIRDIIMNVMSDWQWHGLEELQGLCEEEGISFEGGRGPIYNVTYQLKKKGEIETNGMGEYRICMQRPACDENGEMEFCDNHKNQLKEALETIERCLVKYKNFNWIDCSDVELQDARSNVARLLSLAQKIEKEFKKV